jgi:hypothetical protein
VNNIWQAVFGQGLVETSEDFGTRDPVPEYRELLDWLAVDFMEHGWSRRRLLQMIVSSRTYAQSLGSLNCLNVTPGIICSPAVPVTVPMLK